MKRLIFFVMLFFACFSLFAQNYREARVFVPPVGGNRNCGDKEIFFQRLTCEVVSLGYELVNSRRDCEYILKSYIIPFDEFLLIKDDLFEEETAVTSNPVPAQSEPPVRSTGNRREFFSWEVDDSIHFYDTTGEENYLPLSNWDPQTAESWRALNDIQQGNVFFLELIHKVKNTVLSMGFFVYQSAAHSSENELCVMTRNMISGLPKIPEVDNDKWVFFSASALWAPRIYSNEGNSSNINNFGLNISAELHFLNFMSISAGAQITQDLITISGVDDEFSDLLLEVPLALKLVFKPTDYFRLEPYGGISYNHSLLGTTEPSSLSWFAGLQFGIRAGAGMLVIDPRFFMDFEDSSLSGRDIGYQRICIYLGVGYKIGIIPKRPIRLDY